MVSLILSVMCSPVRDVLCESCWARDDPSARYIFLGVRDQSCARCLEREVPRAGLEPAQLLQPSDFKSDVSTYSTTEAYDSVCPVLHLNLLPLVYHASDQLYTFVDHILRQPAPGKTHKSTVRRHMIQAK